ncbi:MAG: hypothetical protein WDN01_16015 [Rhizomicrobium sp.]
MRLRAALLAIGLAALLGGCTEMLFGEDDSSATMAPNGCTAQGCPQAPRFCQARGYQPDTDAYRRCLVSVEDNLRKGQ